MNVSGSHHQPLTGGIAGVAFLLGNLLCWAIVPVVLRYMTDSLDGWTTNGFRYPFASVLYWPVLFFAWRAGDLNGLTLRRCIAPAVFALAAQILWAWAPYFLPAGAIGFFMRFSLLFAITAAMILFPDERKLLKLPMFYWGLILLVGGFIMMSVSKIQFDTDVTGVGIFIILLCGVFFGLYGVSVRYFLHGINPSVAFGVVSNYVSLGTLSAMFAFGDYEELLSLSLQKWFILASSAVLGIALGHIFLYSAVSRLGAAITSGAQTLIPFPTMLLAGWVLQERMTRLEWGAGLTMVVGTGVLLVAQQQTVRQV